MNCSTPYFLTCFCHSTMSSHSMGAPSLSRPMMELVTCLFLDYGTSLSTDDNNRVNGRALFVQLSGNLLAEFKF